MDALTYIDQAIGSFRLARSQHIDVIEGFERIATLAEQALANPHSALSLLRQIMATATNSADLAEDAASGFSLARISIEHAKGLLRQASSEETTV